MVLVGIVTNLLEKVSAAKLARAEKRNRDAVKKVRQAKARVDKTSFEYKKAQAGVLIQLTKLNKMGEEIAKKSELQSSKAIKIDALLESIDD